MDERWVPGDGVRLRVRGWPIPRRAIPPGLLLLHGLASSSHIWDLVAPELARRGFRVLAYDQRGHGISGKPSSGYGFDRVTADAAAAIRATGLRRPVVAGHSWSADVALELASRRPKAVRGVVLLDGGFLGLRERFDWRTAKDVLAPPDLRGTPVHEFLEFARYRLGGVIEITLEVEAVFLSLMRVGPAREHPPAPDARQPPADPARPVGAGHDGAAPRDPRAHVGARGPVGARAPGLRGSRRRRDRRPRWFARSASPSASSGSTGSTTCRCSVRRRSRRGSPVSPTPS